MGCGKGRRNGGFRIGVPKNMVENFLELWNRNSSKGRSPRRKPGFGGSGEGSRGWRGARRADGGQGGRFLTQDLPGARRNVGSATERPSRKGSPLTGHKDFEITKFVSHVELICLRKRINPSQEPCHAAQSGVTETQAAVLWNQPGLRIDSPFLWDFLFPAQIFLSCICSPTFLEGKKAGSERGVKRKVGGWAELDGCQAERLLVKKKRAGLGRKIAPAPFLGGWGWGTSSFLPDAPEEKTRLCA